MKGELVLWIGLRDRLEGIVKERWLGEKGAVNEN
jgi:hypothetical protein